MYVAFLTENRERIFHIGDKISLNDNEFHIYQLTPDIQWVQADGHELEAIQRLFIQNGQYTIPMPNTSVVRWYVDIARTIHLNMIDTEGFGHVRTN